MEDLILIHLASHYQNLPLITQTHSGTMTKISGFKNRLMGLFIGAYIVILVVLVTITKFILGCLELIILGLWIFSGVIVSPALFILGAGLIPLEIILFLIIGETKVFTVLYELGMKYWSVDVFLGKVSLDLFDLIEKPWMKY